MTDDKIVRMLKSSIEEDKIIAGNWMVRNMTSLEIRNLFDKYGVDTYNIKDGDAHYISGKFISGVGEYKQIEPNYIRTPEYLLFMSWEVWLLKPTYGTDFLLDTFKNVEI